VAMNDKHYSVVVSKINFTRNLMVYHSWYC